MRGAGSPTAAGSVGALTVRASATGASPPRRGSVGLSSRSAEVLLARSGVPLRLESSRRAQPRLLVDPRLASSDDAASVVGRDDRRDERADCDLPRRSWRPTRSPSARPTPGPLEPGGHPRSTRKSGAGAASRIRTTISIAPSSRVRNVVDRRESQSKNMTASNPVPVTVIVYGNAIHTMRRYDRRIRGARADVNRNRNAA